MLTTAALFRFDIWSFAVPAALTSGYLFVLHRAKRLGLPKDEMESAMGWAVVVGFLVSHAVEIVFYQPDRLKKEGFVTLLKFWEGLSSYGGFFGGLLGFGLFYLRRRKRWWREMDVFVQGLFVGWVFGRLGCTISGDHPGARTDFFLAYPYPDGPRHNLGLYELLFTLFVILPANFVFHRLRPPVGSLLAMNCLVYGAGRFALDFLRAADPRYGSLTLAQYCSIAVFLFGAWLLVQARRRRFETPAEAPAS